MSLDREQDTYWMNYALELAKRAELEGEVPVGAVLVRNNTLLGEGWNQSIRAFDPTAHAEILALREGALKLNNYRLLETTLYVTLEPCTMCAGALVHARINRLVFGAFDPNRGAGGSVMNLLQHDSFNHRVMVEGGVLQLACSEMLRNFFKAKR
jgi:tRNA(adenine34) deaminase